VPASADPGPPGKQWEPPRRGPDVGTLLTLGTMTALCLVAGMGLGWLLDRQLASTPVFTLVGLAAGILAAGLATWWQIRTYFRD